MGMQVHRKTRRRAKAMRWPMTRAETILRTRLQRARLMGLHFRKQHPVGPYIADFACVKARLLVEVDGETHWREDERRRDARRAAFLEAEGWAILRVWNSDVYENEEGVVETVARFAMNGVAARGVPVTK